MDIAIIKQAFSKVQNLAWLEEIFEKYLGKHWEISQANKELATLSPEEKKIKWQNIQALREQIQNIYDEKKTILQKAFFERAMEDDVVDYSMSYDVQKQGFMHVLQKERRRIEEIASSLGYSIYYGDEVVSKFENFYSVNIPSTHPSTEIHDTFFLHQDDWSWENLVLRTQTSSMQNHILKKFGAPVRVMIPWKVYRNENTDASHDDVFWQLEGIVVDKGISLANLKGSMQQMLSQIFEKEVQLRMRPSFFPFVEPGLEIDAGCPICNQKWCPLCKQTWWIEILGAGMIHPHVLELWGIDPSIYSGFAFGFGITRIVAIKYGIKDIRYFTSGDLKFLQSVWS